MENDCSKIDIKLKPIRPLEKVPQKAIEKLDMETNLMMWTNIYQKSKDTEKENHKRNNEDFYLGEINNYIYRFCQNTECQKSMFLEKCISACIFPANDIHYINFDDTSIYKISNQIDIFTIEDIKKNRTFYKTIPDQELLNIFHITQIDLPTLKHQLTGNKLINFINQYWSNFDPEDKIDILCILLNPSLKQLNPVSFKNTFSFIYVNCYDDYSSLKKCLHDTCDSKKIDQSFLTDTLTYEKLDTILFNTTIDSFLKNSFSDDSPSAIAEKKKCLDTIIPQILTNTLINISEKCSSEYAYNIMRQMATYLFNSPSLYAFQLFAPTENELLSFFYWHQKYLKQYSNLITRTTISHASPVLTFRSIAAKNMLKSLPDALCIIAQSDNQANQQYLYQKLQEELYNQLDFPINFNLKTDKILPLLISNKIFKEYKSAGEPYCHLRDILFAISDGNTKPIEQLFHLISKVYLGSFFF